MPPKKKTEPTKRLADVKDDKETKRRVPLLSSSSAPEKAMEISDMMSVLNSAIDRKELMDLHTHLTGMGSVDFWVTRIMSCFLESVRRDYTATKMSLIQHLLHPHDWETLSAVFGCEEFRSRMDSGNIPADLQDESLKSAFKSMKLSSVQQQQHFVTKWFTDDVVYSIRRLCQSFYPELLFRNGFQIAEGKGDFIQVEGTEPMFQSDSTLRAIAQFSSLWNNGIHSDSPLKFSKVLRHNVVFNALKLRFEFIIGITNEVMVKRLLESQKLNDTSHFASKLRNAFSFLHDDGSSVHENDYIFHRGNFTPSFYPQRFALKDCILERRPDVFAILLNETAARYGKAGINYVEYSHSLNCLTSLTFWKHVDGKVWTADTMVDGCFQFVPIEPTPTLKLLQSTLSQAKKISESMSEPIPSNIAALLDEVVVNVRDSPKSSSQPRLPTPWQKHYHNYASKPRNFRFTFLAAFNRGLNEDWARLTLSEHRESATPNLAELATPISTELARALSELLELDNLVGLPSHDLSTFQQIVLALSKSRNKAFHGVLTRLVEPVDIVPKLTSNEIAQIVPKLTPEEITMHDGFVTARNSSLQLRSCLEVFFKPLAQLDKVLHQELVVALALGHETVREQLTTAVDLISSKAMYYIWQLMASCDVLLEYIFKPLKRQLKDLERILNPTDEKFISLKKYWQKFVVGFDVLSDEFDQPLTPFVHSKFLEYLSGFQSWDGISGDDIKKQRNGVRKSKFGIRIHSGESVPQYSSLNNKQNLQFLTHILIATHAIDVLLSHTRTLSMRQNNESCPIRIGHGTAFLAFGKVAHQSSNSESLDILKLVQRVRTESDMHDEDEQDPSTRGGINLEVADEIMCDIRSFLSKNSIPIESCPTSNHLLVSDTHTTDQIESEPIIKLLFAWDLKPIVATDNDGIWPIHKCQQHYLHISVAGEICRLINESSIQLTKNRVEEMLKNTKDSAFIVFD